MSQRKKYHGDRVALKIVRSGERYYWNIYTPGFPSKGFEEVIQREIQKSTDGPASGISIQTMILSISSRCTYNCEHCYEGNNLSEKELLSYEDLCRVLDDAKRNGVRHIQLSGGEPLLRFEDLVRLIIDGGKYFDFWLSTSGYGLTKEVAKALKKAGLTGVTVSLDHWNQDFHNRFRGHPEAWEWALKAVKHCHEAGILTNLTLCVTREMANTTDLMKYMDLARELKVPFVRFLEARSVGSFKGTDVLLRKAEQDEVLRFYLELNSQKKYNSYPIIQYTGYHQRKLGCYGAGNRYLHVDVKGDYHACPFCRGTVGNTRDTSLREAIDALQEKGCQQFETKHYV
ncbi:MAG: radical SAM protein [Bacteroidota bacterium]